MTGYRAYLDYNASAPLLPEARTAMLAALDASANPSSVHGEGRNARRIVEDARREVAALVNTKPDHVVFTSGATEAASTLLTPDWRMGRGDVRMSRLYVSAADHPCLLTGGRFPGERAWCASASIGTASAISPRSAPRSPNMIARKGLPLVAIHLANNETGVIQPAREIGKIVKDAGGVLVLDAVQAAGRIPLDMSDGSADYLILSSHKIGGPIGRRRDRGGIRPDDAEAARHRWRPGKGPSRGNGKSRRHRRFWRGGAGGARNAVARARDCRDARPHRADDPALAPDAEIFGRGTERLANTAFFAIPGLKAETAQIGFDLAGVALSAGSACSSGKVGPSHVLKAMGHDNDGALRVSIGRGTTTKDIDLFATALSQILARRARSG